MDQPTGPPPPPADAASRMHRSAALLSRMMADTVKGLEARQARAPGSRGGKTP